MDAEKIFVGRKAELERFKTVLEEPQGQAVLVVGQAGMGKTWLINKMTEIAKNHEKLKCGFVRYEVTPTDSPNSIMELMIDHAFDAARVCAGLLDKTPKRAEQFRTFLNLFGNVGDFVDSFKRDPLRHTRDQFLERLNLISEWMPAKGRAIFVIDPEKYMMKKSDQSWAIVVKNLPEKIKFIFAQRPEDELVKGRAFKGLENTCYIPNERLGALGEPDVKEFVLLRAVDVGKSVYVLENAVKRYKGHPYAIAGALDIVKKTKSVENLPQDPTPRAIAEGQWERICDSGDEAVKLFEGYAILEVGVPDEVVQTVSGLGTTTRKRLQKDGYLKGLLREEGEGKRIYHAILADYISGQMSEDEKKDYHGRAVGVYRARLAKAREEQIKPDALAAMRLAGHVLEAEGKEAFIYAFVNECYEPLDLLGLYDAAIGLSERALGITEKDSEEEAAALGNLGVIYNKRGELDKAEEMHLKSLGIEKNLGRFEGMASQYGNLGIIYGTRGDLDKAEEMFRDGLKIDEKLGRLEGMASKYGNWGIIYRRRGELYKAEEMHLKSLEIEKKLGRLEGMASEYGNLGNIYYTKGELDKAEEMHLKALKIHEDLGHKEGMAREYGNLGNIYYTKGELDKAKEYWEKALELYKKIGMPHMVEKVEGWIEGIGKKKN